MRNSHPQKLVRRIEERALASVNLSAKSHISLGTAFEWLFARSMMRDCRLSSTRPVA